MSVTPDARSELRTAGILTDFDQHARREEALAERLGRAGRDQACEARRLDLRAIDFVELCVHKRTIRPWKVEDQLALARALRVEAGGRLVEQDDAWLVQEAARERDALPQPLRELGRPVVGPVRNVEQRQRFAHRRGDELAVARRSYSRER